ncbi:hypothetical protein ONZ45_g18908 [Pleurotus djamor]|nr:hypothetical protein ONZ45_g18908 [Pleurotus djamor]
MVTNGQAIPLQLTDQDMDRIITVINTSWASGTKETYGAGLLIYHLFCDSRAMDEPSRCPAHSVTILTFIATLAGLYSGKTLHNYVYAVRAWHILHGQPWSVVDTELKAALEGASRLAPATSKRPKRKPITLEFLKAAYQQLDRSQPLHAAVLACLFTSFFSLARLGEMTVKSLAAFSPDLHPKPSDLRLEQDRNGIEVQVCHLPSSKTQPAIGEDIFWATQLGDIDPRAALEAHLQLNRVPPDKHLFSWRHRNGLRPLTKSEFLNALAPVATSLSMERLQGHSIRIGGTLEFLLRGTPFEVVKSLGRWSSDAFQLYLRRHAVVIAPYIQESPILEEFTRITMPALR